MNYPYAKKLGLVLAVSSVLAITGCDTSTDKVAAPPRSDALSFIPGTAPRFNPAAQDLPFNTDLVFAAAATSDGTADLGPATDPVRSAVNNLDGFSTSAYFDIGFDGSVDPDTVFGPGSANQNVFLVELNTGSADALDPTNIDPDDPFVLPPTSAYRVDVVSLDGGTNNVVRVLPTAPLSSKSKYLVFMTNGIENAVGDAVTASGSYNLIRSDANISANLLPVRGAIQGWEQLAAGFLNAVTGVSVADAKKSLVLTYTFTTTDPLAPLVGMASARSAIAGLQIEQGVGPGDAVSNVNMLVAGGLLPHPVSRALDVSPMTAFDMGNFSPALADDVATLYTGYIKLPYYQFAPSSTSDYAFLGNNWRPDQTLAGALGVDLPADVDGSFNVTYRYPFAARQSIQSVPLQVTLPDPDHAPAFGGGATCSQLVGAPANPITGGYPVVIYVHGITSDRASVAALGHTLGSQCIATVAIDQPMHGIPSSSAAVGLNVGVSGVAGLYGADAPNERHFNIVQGPSGPQPMNYDTPNALVDTSGSQFINLTRLQNTRDNMRQAVMDLLNLNASLDAIAQLDLDGDDDTGTRLFSTDKVYVVGVSLGGIVGTVFTTVNELAIANDAQLAMAGLPASQLNPIQGLAASAAGTQLSQILANSQTFGPVITAGLGAAGVNVGTTNFERFLYAAQSTVDSGDPVSFAETLAGLNVPVLLQQIVGGGNASGLGDTKTYVADKVVPNSAASAPLTGTTALADLLSAVQVGAGLANATTDNALVNLTIGHHASILRPNEEGSEAPVTGENVATAELQTQVASFVLSGGAQIAVGSAPNDEDGDPTNLAAPFIQAP
ncbi:MAG: hypothetical protein CVV10_00680 [Gammaproteobacteria bacterium HGW-Gammaproteobacteria-14]|nr:MAG: hypothetical protein CVV10_00680 [Gammaproteobacteria bacterium HGW-Gammaproteobacteria-14]